LLQNTHQQPGRVGPLTGSKAIGSGPNPVPCTSTLAYSLHSGFDGLTVSWASLEKCFFIKANATRLIFLVLWYYYFRSFCLTNQFFSGVRPTRC